MFSPDGAQLAISNNSNLLLWNVGTWEQTIQLENPTWISEIAFSPDGTQIAAALRDNTARVWDLKTGDTLAVLRGHTDAVASVAYHPDGRLIVTGGNFDKTARIWNIAAEQSVLVLNGHLDRVYTALFSPDGKQILTASADDTAQLWDAKTGTSLAVLRSPGMLSATFSPDGTRIVTTGRDGAARVWSKASVNP
jgi:WD40 repeat protein